MLHSARSSMCNKDTLIAKQHLPSDSMLPNDPLQYVLPAAFVPPPLSCIARGITLINKLDCYNQEEEVSLEIM